MKIKDTEKRLLEELINETVTRLIDEEFIGNVGGVNLYQMGGSIKRPELYNLDSKGKPTRDPGVAGIKKRRRRKKNETVLRLLKNILISEIESKTVKLGTGKAVSSAPDVSDEKTVSLERIFKSGQFTFDDIISIAQIFYNILDKNEIPKYIDVIENLPNIDKFNSVVDGLDNPRVQRSIPRDLRDDIENSKKIIGKVSNTIEAELQKREKEDQGTTQAKPQTQISTKKKPTLSMDVGADFMKFAKNVQNFKDQIENKIDAIAKSAGIDSSKIKESLKKAIMKAQSDIDDLRDRAMFVVDALRGSLPTAGTAKETEAEKELLSFVGEKLALSEGRVFNHLFGDNSTKNAIACAILLCALSN